MIYFLVFCLSCFFFNLPKYVKNESITKVSYFIAVMIPVILSAFRGINVGKDVTTYAYPTFLYASRVSNFGDLLGYLGMEPGYLLIVYIGAKYLHSFSFVLGFNQLVVDYCFYKVIREKNGEDDLAITMMVFYLFIYGSTLNAMRQSVAISLSLLSTYYFTEKKYRYSIILVIIAFTFHMSAIVSVLFWVIYFIADKERIYRIVNVIIVVSSFVLYNSWNGFLSRIINFIMLWTNRYSGYLSYVKVGERNETSIICGVLAIIILFFVNRAYRDDFEGTYIGVDKKWYKLMMSASLLFLFYQPLVEKIYAISRFLMYPQALMILAYPKIKEVMMFRSGDKEVGWVADGFIVVFFFASFFYSVILNNANSIMPYTFRSSL